MNDSREAPRLPGPDQLGWALRTVTTAAASFPAHASLGAIDVGVQDEARIEAIVRESLRLRAEMTVEQSVRWGSLVLFCVARAAQRGRPVPLWGMKVPPVLWGRVEQGAAYWERFGIRGSADALERARAAVSRGAEEERAIEAADGWHIEVESMPAILGLPRFRVRVDSDGAPAHEVVWVEFSVTAPADVVIEVADAPGLRHGRRSVEVPVGGEAEVVFYVKGASGRRMRKGGEVVVDINAKVVAER